MELCSIVNRALSTDDAALVLHVVAIVRAHIITLLVRCACAIPTPFPPCWRGGGFDDAHQAFYTVGREYRVPAFLATSERPVEDLYRAVMRS